MPERLVAIDARKVVGREAVLPVVVADETPVKNEDLRNLAFGLERLAGIGVFSEKPLRIVRDDADAGRRRAGETVVVVRRTVLDVRPRMEHPHLIRPAAKKHRRLRFALAVLGVHPLEGLGFFSGRRINSHWGMVSVSR